MKHTMNIPKDWKLVKLGEMAEIIKKNYLPNNKENLKYIGLEHIEEGKLRLNSIGVSSEVKSTKYLFKAGDILFGKLRPDFRKVVKVNFDGVCSTDIWVIVAKQGVDQSYLFYFLANWDFINLANYGEGGTRMPRADWNFLKQIEFPLPPLSEQKAIAGVLSSIDDKIELLHRQNKTLEEMAMTLFRQWFIEPTKDGLPDGWEEVSLGDSKLSQIIPSGIKKFEGFKTYLATGDVKGTLIKGGVEITYNNRPSRANMQPEKYSVWFAKKEGVRKLLMFDDRAVSTHFDAKEHSQSLQSSENGARHSYSNTDKYILSTGFTGLKTNELSHYYIWCFILSKDFQDIKDSLVSGSVQPDIPNEAVLQIFIPRPPNEVLLSFNEKVKPLFTKIQFNTYQIQTLEKLRDTLLPKLMSGEIRVKI